MRINYRSEEQQLPNEFFFLQNFQQKNDESNSVSRQIGEKKIGKMRAKTQSYNGYFNGGIELTRKLLI